MATITQRYTIDDVPSEVFSVRFSNDGLLLATGCNDGVVRVYNGKTGAPIHNLIESKKGTLAGTTTTPDEDELESPAMPITALRFRPSPGTTTASTASTPTPTPTTTTTTTRNVLLACGADGFIRHWHVPSARVLSCIQEKDNQIFACDYRSDGLAFATGGRDKAVRVYDEVRALEMSSNTNNPANTNSIGHSSAASGAPAVTAATVTMRGGGYSGSVSMGSSSSSGGSSSGGGDNSSGGHSNRIFAIAWHPTDPTSLISGGWDNTIQFYDTRVGHAVRSIYGPHICGDALSISPDGQYILSGAWRPDEAMQLWDFHTGKLVVTVPWLRGNSEIPSYLSSIAGVSAVKAGKASSSAFASPARATLAAIDAKTSSSTSSSSSSSNGAGTLPSAPFTPYVKPDPCMFYTASFSRSYNSSSSTNNNTTIAATTAAATPSATSSSSSSSFALPSGGYLFAGGSGTNGGKIFRTSDLLAFSQEIATATTQGASGTYTVPFSTTTSRPLLATIAGLPRGIYGMDWDGNAGFAIVGGDQPVRVFDITAMPEAPLVAAAAAPPTSPSAITTTTTKKKTGAGGARGLRARLAAAAASGGDGATATSTTPASPSAAASENTNVAAPPQPPPPSSSSSSSAVVAASSEAEAAVTQETETAVVTSSGSGSGADDELDEVFGPEDDDEDDDEDGLGINEEEEAEEDEAAAAEKDDSVVFDAGYDASASGGGSRPMSAGRFGPIASPATNNRRGSSAVHALRNTVQQARAGDGEEGEEGGSSATSSTLTHPIAGVTNVTADEAAIVAEYGGAESPTGSTASIESLTGVTTTVGKEGQ